VGLQYRVENCHRGMGRLYEYHRSWNVEGSHASQQGGIAQPVGEQGVAKRTRVPIHICICEQRTSLQQEEGRGRVELEGNDGLEGEWLRICQ